MAVSNFSSQQSWLGVQTKHLAMISLVLQNSSLVMLMHYSRTMPLVDGLRYLPSTAVLLSEIMKLSISLTMALYDAASRQPNSTVTALFSNLFWSIVSRDSWKLSIPAVLYTLQNSLQYLAISNLDAPTFQITYQMKILTTGIFSILILKRSLSFGKWMSLLALTVGVAMVQFSSGSLAEDWKTLTDGAEFHEWFKTMLPQNFDQIKNLGSRAIGSLAKRSATYQGIDEDEALLNPHRNRTMGGLAVLIACICSGLAGVYFEKLLKDHSLRSTRTGGRTHISLWVRNVQLSFFSIWPALLVGVIFKDGEHVSRSGFFGGYNWVVWIVIALQASGGILVALVINHANNIAKNFATSASMVITVVASMFLFDLSITFQFLLGTFIVVFATWLYHVPEKFIAPMLVVEDYEKQQASQSDRGYFDFVSDPPSRPRTPLEREAYSTSSRPGTPASERQHMRTVSGRSHFEKGE